MDFKTNKPIYQQIVDFCFSKILTREWQAEERVVSVRELSTQLAVNSRFKAHTSSLLIFHQPIFNAGHTTLNTYNV